MNADILDYEEEDFAYKLPNPVSTGSSNGFKAY